MHITQIKELLNVQIRKTNLFIRIILIIILSLIIASSIGYIVYKFALVNEEYKFNRKSRQISEELNKIIKDNNDELIKFKTYVSIQENFNKREFDKYTDTVLSDKKNNMIYMMDFMVNINEYKFNNFYQDLKEEYLKDNYYLTQDIEVAINENKEDNVSQKQYGPKNYDVIKYVAPPESTYHYIGYDVSSYNPIKENLKQIRLGKDVIPVSRRYRDKGQNEFYFIRTYMPILKNNQYYGAVGISVRLDKILFGNIGNKTTYIYYQIFYEKEEGKALMFDSRYERKSLDDSWPKELLNDSDNKFISEMPFKIGNKSFYIKTFSKDYSPRFMGYNLIGLIIFFVFIINMILIYYGVFRKHKYLKISEREKLRFEKLEKQTNTDELTNLPNRRAFLQYLKRELEDIPNEKKNIYLFFIDLDSFKRINDTLGHSAGDEVLKEYSVRLKSFAENNNCEHYRLGGDEFVIIMKQQIQQKLMSTECQISVLAKKILELTTVPFIVKNESFTLTQSIGIAEYTNGNVTPEELFKNADIAMYEAKRKGKNTYMFFSKELFEKIEKNNQILNYLDEAIGKNEFSLQFQPKMKKINGRYVIKSVEALIRWNCEKLGCVSPVIFIPLAEEGGLMNKIGHWVVEDIARIVHSWKGFPLLKDITVSINLSVKQLNNILLPEIYFQILDDYNLSPRQFIIEVTESAMMVEPEKTKEILLKFRKYGFKISVDDFGTGHSSLSYLRQFPVNEIKIDKSFTDDILIDEQDRIIVEGVISMAKKLNLNVVIEGVETKEQLDCLESHCIDNNEIEIQGYYFSKPLLEENLKLYVETNSHFNLYEK